MFSKIFNGKRVFISGGNGVIGKELVTRLHNHGADIFVGDLKPLPTDWPPEIIYRQGDLNYITKEELDTFAPEYFFHLAATFERSIETYNFWEDNYHHNIKLSNYLMSLLKDSKYLKRVVFTSSYLIYDPALYSFDKFAQKAYRLKETSSIYPRNLTGVAKLLHEIELKFINDFNKNELSCISVRIFRSYGKHSRDIISRWIRALIKGEDLKVYRREGLFDYIYAGDVAEGLMRLAVIKEATGIVNLGNDNARRVDEVLQILKKHFPGMKSIDVDSNIPFEASQANMDSFYKLTGWKPNAQLEDSIPMLIENERREPYKEVNEFENKNILVTSISKKVPLLKNLKKASMKISKNISIFGGDKDRNCIGKYFVDQFWCMPGIDDLTINDILKFCHDNSINGIIPTRDGELLFWAKYKRELAGNKIRVMLSDYDVVQFCIDKLLFFKKCKKLGYNAVPTYAELEKVKSNGVVVKERFGAGAKSIGIDLCYDDAAKHAAKLEEAIYQPFIEGREVSIDLYITLKGDVKGVIARRRDLVINGESQVTTTFRNQELEEMCIAFAREFKLNGHIVMQTIIDEQDKFHVIECNSRFGGASTTSISAGLDSFYWFLLEINGFDLKQYHFQRKKNEIRQIRFPEDTIIYDPNI